MLEDDYDSEFRYAGRPIPAMAGFDRLNCINFLLERLSDDYDRYGNRYGSFKDHKAGMQIAFHLNTQARDTVIAELATARGLAGKPLSSFSVGHESPNGLLLGFCGYNKDEMAKALATLKSTLSSNFV
ncbi:MAG: hypothetical protein WA888_18615 [Burkholderiaceae bacterium]